MRLPKSHKPTPIPSIPGAGTCDIEAEITGAFEASWTGEVQASSEDGRVSFIAQNDDVVLTAARISDLMSVSITKGRATYTTAAGDEGVSIDKQGTSADIDADAIQGGTANGVHVVATIDC